MRIKKIHLRNNFKRFKDLTIELGENPRKIIALVGGNGCGKSSVFDGMMLLQNSHHQIGRYGSGDSRFYSMIGENYQPRQGIDIIFDKGDITIKYMEKNQRVAYKQQYLVLEVRTVITVI